MVAPRHVSHGVLFCDVAGSMRLYRDLGDDRAHTVVTKCLAAVGHRIAASGGRVVKTIGDAIMAIFPDAPATFEAALAIQSNRGLANDGLPEPDGVRFRIGFHCGPVVLSDGDVFGTTVNVAARLTVLAKADQIITTAATVELLERPQRAATRLLAAAHARGLAEDIVVAEVLWQAQAMTQTLVFPVQAEAARAPTSPGALKILSEGRRWVFDRARDPITLGRAAENTIVVPNYCASRHHATIEPRWDKWVLIDHSTNGTFVRSVGAAECRLCREELILHAAGTLSLGCSLADATGIDFVLSAD